MVVVGVSRVWTRSRGSYLWRRQGWAVGTLGGRPVLGVIWPTVMRRFESDVENAAQDHAEVQIGAMTWYQGNPSMPDAAAAERGLVRDHGPQDWTSSPPRGVLSPRIAGQDFSECRRPEVGAGQRRDAVSVHLATLYHHLPLSIPTAHICTTYPYHLPSSLPPTPIPTFLPPTNFPAGTACLQPLRASADGVRVRRP